MFELPEYVNFAKQINTTLSGKRIAEGRLGNSPHKFVWYNRSPSEFQSLTKGKVIGRAYSKGKWLFIPLEPKYLLVFGESGGRILYHPPDTSIPKKYHLLLAFSDRSSLTAMTQMWGAMELYKKNDELNRKYIKDMKPIPTDEMFTLAYFKSLIDDLSKESALSVKGLLTQNQLIPGLGNAIAQDILFNAKLHPKHLIHDLTVVQKRRLFLSIKSTIQSAIEGGGRNDERDLFDQPGEYTRIMDKNAVGHPCPGCGRLIEKIQFLGGACYFCPKCQT
jgi:formamidopyrimidine-DNA glycosylase